MDNIEPRVHSDISKYKEKFYGFTFRQIIALVLIVVLLVPLYLFLKPYIGGAADYVIIICSIPIVFWGFIPIQEMNAEVIIKYIYRSHMLFYKEIPYKTEKELELEKRERKNNKNKKKKILDKKLDLTKKEIEKMQKQISQIQTVVTEKINRNRRK